MNVRIVKTDGTSYITCASVLDNGATVKFSKENVDTSVQYIDFLYDYFVADVGDEGYFLLPLECTKGVNLTYFTKRDDTEYADKFSQMMCYGMRKNGNAIFAIVTGMKWDYGLVAGVKGGRYYAYPRFYVDGDGIEEDICIKFYNIKDGTYSDMARIYRDYQFKNAGCEPLSERVKRDSRLERSASSVAVRVRQAWKPAPSLVENQDLATEPPVNVACDFDKLDHLLDLFKAADIKRTEFCLVGWNRMGHDGRFPQILPVEPALGGEEKLRRVIKKAKDYGYSMVGHDNAHDAYTVSEEWDEEYLSKQKDGSFFKMDIWSSGRAYKICPQRYFERFALEHNEKLSDLGFEGIHYSDVVTILSLTKCYDINHPLTRADSVVWYIKLMEDSRKRFGGFSSEAGYDFAADLLDYALYTSFCLSGDGLPEICDQPVPFWQLVYHGIILYNPGTYTLNYPAKSINNRLKYFEYGGRPLACINANFATGKNWMGNEDLRSETEEGLVNAVSAIKLMQEDYDWMQEVRYAYMDKHTILQGGTTETEYSNGIKIVVDYNAAKVTMVSPDFTKERYIK